MEMSAGTMGHFKVKLHKSQGSPFPLGLELQIRRMFSSQIQDLNLFLNRVRGEKKIQADNKKGSLVNNS